MFRIGAWPKPVIAFLIIATVSACSNTEKDKGDIAKKALKNVSGPAVTGKVSLNSDGISIPLKSGSINLKVAKNNDASKQITKKSLVPPGVKKISQIVGIRDGMIYNISTTAGIEMAGKMFTSHLKQNGYRKISSYLLDGMFSGNWVNKVTQTRVRMYAYQKEAETRVSLAVSKIAETKKDGSL